jgi:hypothetical protein
VRHVPNREQGKVWVQIRVARTLPVAEAWRELFENQGIPCKLWPLDGQSHGAPLASYQVLVPNDRLHVADVVLSHTF